MKKTALLCMVTFCIGLSPAAFANHHEAQAMDHDKCESMSQTSYSISGLDTNQDGHITQAEYLAGDASNNAKIFSHIDANKDGKLDSAEQTEIEAVYKSLHQAHKAKKTNI
ncbi:MAG TPA: hypothetical protein VGD04_11365 [Methylophilus sp.]